MKENMERKKHTPLKSHTQKKRNKRVKKTPIISLNKSTVLITICVLLGMILLFFILNKHNTNQHNVPIKVENINPDYTRLKVDDNNTLLLVSNLDTKDSKKDNNSFSEIYLESNDTKKRKLIKKTDNTLSFVSFEEKHFYERGKEKLLIIYEYTTQVQEGKEQKIVAAGYVFSITNNTVKEIYKTTHLFGSATIDNGNLVIYERLPKDEMNVYPSYLKPYERIKMVYTNGKFLEKNRTFIEPINEYQEKSNR